MPGPLDYKRYKHGCDPHDIPMKHYFDAATGIRGSDKGHKAALDYYRRISPLPETKSGTLQVAREGFEIAEQTRREVAGLLGCEPKNIFFGNSATRTLIPIFLSLGKGRCRLIVNRYEYYAIYGLVAEGDEPRLDGVVTRQNFGADPGKGLLRVFNDEKRLADFVRKFNLHVVSDAPECPPWKNQQWELRNILYLAHADRLQGHVISEGGFTGLQKKMMEIGFGQDLLIVDASHTFGAMRFDAPSLGDIVIMNSSKALGAEPTVGICYVENRVLRLLEEELPATGWPRIAFQFSPETRLGARSPEEAARLRHWISLPELFSLHEILREGRNPKGGETASEMKYYLNLMLRLLKSRFGKPLGLIVPDPSPIANIVSFGIEKEGFDLSRIGEQFLESIEPYRINCEISGSHLVRGDEHRMLAFRISWSSENTLEHARDLIDKITEALYSIEGLSHRIPLAEAEAVFCGPESEALKRISNSSDRGIFRVTATWHRYRAVRESALRKLKSDRESLIEIAKLSPHADSAISALDALGRGDKEIFWIALISNNGKAVAHAEKMLGKHQLHELEHKRAIYDRPFGIIHDLYLCDSYHPGL